MTMTPTNAEGLAQARAALGARTHKRPFVAKEARMLACLLDRADQLERVAGATIASDDATALGAHVAAAVYARDHADLLCLNADLYTHLEAAALRGGAA